MGTQSFFGKNMVGQEPWALRGVDDARVAGLETSRTADEAQLALKNLRVLDTTGAEVSATTAYQLQMGTTVGATDVNGVLVVTFPTAYPSALVTVIAVMGFDTKAFLVVSDNYVTDNTTTQFVVRAYTDAGAALASTTIRVNWFALGY